jgi:hypothetical protein
MSRENPMPMGGNSYNEADAQREIREHHRMKREISDEDMRYLLSAKDVGTGRARLRRILAVRASDGQGDAMRADRDGPCFYCGEQTCNVAGDPGRWPLVFCQPDGTGIARTHCTRCVSNRLAALPKAAQGEVAPSPARRAKRRTRSTSSASPIT